MTKRFVVLGNPISHSKSPLIHQHFADQLGISIQYRQLLAPLSGFEQTVAMLRTTGVSGANVTVPFKQQAAALADYPSDAVVFAKAANTLTFDETGAIHADNTDGLGLCLDLERLLKSRGNCLSGAQLVIIGAGGAASGCIQALKDAGVSRLLILNRTPEKADALARRANDIGLAADGGGLGDLPNFLGGGARVVVNASSSSLGGGLPSCNPALYEWADLALDMMYGAEPTAFIKAVIEINPKAEVADGLGMLVNQASVAFEIWTGKRPDRLLTLQYMRTLLGNG